MSQSHVRQAKPQFDRTVHVRDRKTGAVTQVNPYRMRVVQNGETTVERDGVVYDAAGKRLREVVGEALAKTPRSYKVYQSDAELRAAVTAETRESLAAEMRESLAAERVAIETEVRAKIAKEQAAVAPTVAKAGVAVGHGPAPQK